MQSKIAAGSQRGEAVAIYAEKAAPICRERLTGIGEKQQEVRRMENYAYSPR